MTATVTVGLNGTGDGVVESRATGFAAVSFGGVTWGGLTHGRIIAALR